MVSLIVPLWNHLEDLTQVFVASMLACKGDFELILVDNGSKDETKKYLKSIKDKRVKKVYSNINLGFGGGNNLGYKEAEGDEICFISNDVLIKDKDWLNKFQERLAYEKKALLGPQFVDYNQLTNFKRIPTPYICGWCMFGTKEMFDKVVKINGVFDTRPQVFDEDFGLAYFEDVWLGQQCQELGYKLVSIVVELHHIVSGSSDQINITPMMLEAQKVFLEKMTKADLIRRGVKRIVFVCPGVPYGFVDEDFEGKGVGGAEASLILLSRELAKLGWQVDIYNKTETIGEFNGVNYHHISEASKESYCDVFVLFRSFHISLKKVSAKVKIFWSCDQYTDAGGIWDLNIFPNVDKTIAISPYHKKYLNKIYKTKRNSNVEVIELGINYEDYKDKVKKIPGKMIFCSIPDRGLSELAQIIPVLKRAVPNFNLIITSDYRLWGTDDPANQGFRSLLEIYPFVEFLGKIPRNELVKHQLESEFMAYPSNYPECFCISAMECMAAGAVPVTIGKGALETTVGKGGLVLSNSATPEQYVKLLVALVKKPKRVSQYREAGYKISEDHSWVKVTKKWISLFNRLEVKKSMGNKDKKVKVVASTVTASKVKPALKAVQTGKVAGKSDFVLKKKTKTAPDTIVDEAVMPKNIVLKFSVPVEVDLNGTKFASKPMTGKADVHEMEVPYDMHIGILTIVHQAYGTKIVLV